jgi:hypothetical protein
MKNNKISIIICIALGYGLDDGGFESQQELGIFFSPLRPDQPPIRWVPGALSLGLKRKRCEADHSPLSSAEVKNAWRYNSIKSTATTLPLIIRGNKSRRRYLSLYSDQATYWATGVRFRVRAEICSLPHWHQTGSTSHPAFHSMSTGGSFRGIKRPDRKADHSVPSSVDVQNAWNCTSTTPYVFMAW